MTPKEFKTIRQALDLTQTHLAERIGRKMRMIGHYETGTHKIPLLVANYMLDAVELCDDCFTTYKKGESCPICWVI